MGIEGAIPRENAEEMLRQVQGWGLVEDAIERSFSLPNFVEAMKFANQITPIAEQENHHPDLHISYGKVRVELSTHKVGGLTENDFILAAKINQLWDQREEAASI